MDPFARKMWRAGFGFAGLMVGLLAALTIIYVHQWPRCPDRVVGETHSADGRWIAAILERRCGAESPFVTRVSLRPPGPIKRGFFSGQVTRGNVFAIEQDAAGAAINLIWSAKDVLTVKCPRCNLTFIRQQDQHWGTVKIQYEP
jgi:hypothetical protein